MRYTLEEELYDVVHSIVQYGKVPLAETLYYILKSSYGEKMSKNDVLKILPMVKEIIFSKGGVRKNERHIFVKALLQWMHEYGLTSDEIIKIGENEVLRKVKNYRIFIESNGLEYDD